MMREGEEILLSPEEEDEALRTVAVVGEWVEGLFPMEYFLDMVDSAVHRQYMYWGTQTETLEDGSKRSRVIFVKSPEKRLEA